MSLKPGSHLQHSHSAFLKCAQPPERGENRENQGEPQLEQLTYEYKKAQPSLRSQYKSQTDVKPAKQ